MPATEHRFSDTPPRFLYLDNDFVLTYFVATRPYHLRCKAFLERVQSIGLTTLCVSPLLWIEYAHTVRRDDFRAALPQATRGHFRFERWQHDPSVRGAWFAHALAELDGFLSEFEVEQIEFTEEVRVLALEYMDTHNLGGHDAVHVASAKLAGVSDLASFDRGYRRIDGLHLWNDRVFNQR